MSPPTLAQVLAGHPGRQVALPKPRPQCKPLLNTWPKGYERGGFRLDGDDVLIFAKGMPTLRLKG
jgi:hypothetical protein